MFTFNNTYLSIYTFNVFYYNNKFIQTDLAISTIIFLAYSQQIIIVLAYVQHIIRFSKHTAYNNSFSICTAYYNSQ